MALRILPRKSDVLEIGTNGLGDVTVFNPKLEGGQRVQLTPSEARGFAWTLEQKAQDAENEVKKVKVG